MFVGAKHGRPYQRVWSAAIWQRSPASDKWTDLSQRGRAPLDLWLKKQFLILLLLKEVKSSQEQENWRATLDRESGKMPGWAWNRSALLAEIHRAEDDRGYRKLCTQGWRLWYFCRPSFLLWYRRSDRYSCSKCSVFSRPTYLLRANNQLSSLHEDVSGA